MSTTEPVNELHTARVWAAQASEFVFPLYRTVDGQREVFEVIKVASLGLVPDGRWTAQHGPFHCMAERPDEWVAYACNFEELGNQKRDQEEGRRWKAFLAEATFTSLTKVIEAAVAEQQKAQVEIDSLPKGKGGLT